MTIKVSLRTKKKTRLNMIYNCLGEVFLKITIFKNRENSISSKSSNTFKNLTEELKILNVRKTTLISKSDWSWLFDSVSTLIWLWRLPISISYFENEGSCCFSINSRSSIVFVKDSFFCWRFWFSVVRSLSYKKKKKKLKIWKKQPDYVINFFLPVHLLQQFAHYIAVHKHGNFD